MFIWVHDQIVPDSQTFFYSHYDSDWDASSPFFDALLSSWALWSWIYFLMKKQLRRYMNFFFKRNLILWEINRKFRVSDIVGWKSLVDLKDIRLRIVAANIERWQYVRWSWSHRRTVSFSNPVRWVVLYDKNIDFIPKKTDISSYFKWDLSFKNMYKVYSWKINIYKFWNYWD